MSNDISILRDLAKQVAQMAAKPVQDRRRDLWRRHNSLRPTAVPIYTRWFACVSEIIRPEELRCTDPFFRNYEMQLRESILQDRIADDSIIEPYLTVQATYTHATGESRWGLPIRMHRPNEPRGSGIFDPPVKTEADLERLAAPTHGVDEAATARNVERLAEAVGDILSVTVDRGPYHRGWIADLSTDVARLRGLEQILWDMVDKPEFLHRLMGFLRDAILRVHQQAEEAGDWRLFHHNNQAAPYSLELADPRADSPPVKRKELWCFLASQETTLVSPAMFDEFIVQYQLPIGRQFGLLAYGCCENLTRKIDVLRQFKNLRRIAVTPWADVRSCAEQIGRDYVYSWRPSPAESVCTGFDQGRTRALVRQTLQVARANNCRIDITLKDVETVGGDFGRLVDWTATVREVCDEFGEM
jgi:hypothetical protein